MRRVPSNRVEWRLCGGCRPLPKLLHLPPLQRSRASGLGMVRTQVMPEVEQCVGIQTNGVQGRCVPACAGLTVYFPVPVPSPQGRPLRSACCSTRSRLLPELLLPFPPPEKP